MANAKITALTAVVTPVDVDVFPVVQDPSGTPVTKKITWTVIKAFLKTYLDTLYTPIIPPGFIQMYGGSAAPTGWLFCDGSAINRTTYAALFAILSTTYGTGDGSTTFNVPDLRGRVPIGVGTGTGGGASGSGLPTGGVALTARARGDWLGEETHLLTTPEMPAHTHLDAATLNAATGSAVRGAGATTTATSSTGGGGAHNTMEPGMVVNFIIKT